MNVEDYMLEGICDDCDQDPVMCCNLCYCYYDHLNEEKEKKADGEKKA